MLDLVREEDGLLSIGQLARAAGVGVETIRFYERKGLIEQPRRPPAGARRYPLQAAARVTFIQQAQELGFTLAEIKELLALRLDPGTSCAEVKAKAEEKINDIGAKIRRLRHMRGALVEITKTCSGTGPTSDCPILDYMAGPRPGRR
jgi:MerR family copper efflux transcriptional regulator